ncbi:MAG: hypothetical protein V2J25_08380 [Desulfatiglans sp.]|nr:hypothetical protein [Desulfatiglans sp.]
MKTDVREEIDPTIKSNKAALQSIMAKRDLFPGIEHKSHEYGGK